MNVAWLSEGSTRRSREMWSQADIVRPEGQCDQVICNRMSQDILCFKSSARSSCTNTSECSYSYSCVSGTATTITFNFASCYKCLSCYFDVAGGNFTRVEPAQISAKVYE
jgi:hypothetical protein